MNHTRFSEQIASWMKLKYSILDEIENPCSPRGNTNHGKHGELVLLQELEDQEKAVPSACIELIDSFRKDPQDVPEKASTAPTSESLSSALVLGVPIPSSGQKCYTAVTLELSQPENQERKTQALAAVTTELEKLFKTEDFSRMKAYAINVSFFIKLPHFFYLLLWLV
ncbi:hypothetical protein CRYUN_Cryun14cG0087900 [Craigia yunnanensis]